MVISLALQLANRIDIRALGAVGDGVTLCTQPIQRAIDQASRIHGAVDIPPGRFVSGSLHLKSHCEIHLASGAVLLGSPHRSDYEKGVWYAFIMAAKVDDVKLTGPGTIDGNGALVSEDVRRMVHIGQLSIPPGRWRPSEIERPEVIEMTGCRNVSLDGIGIHGGAGWTETYRDCVGLNVHRVRVNANTYWNNDGIDVDDCQHVHVWDCDFNSDDDGICLKSDVHTTACEDVLVEHCRVRSSASAIKFGTASVGGFRHIRIRDIHIHDTFRSAVALESVDGGLLEDVEISHIRAVNTGNAFFIRLGHRNAKLPPGKVRQITLRDFDVQVPATRPDAGYPFPCPPGPEKYNVCPSSVVGIDEAPVENIRLEHIRIRMPGGADKRVAYAPLTKVVPERKAVYPEFTMFGELPAWGLYLRHVRGIELRDFTLVLDRPDYRSPIVETDCSRVSRTNVRILKSRTGTGTPSR
jgi:polygalacturonase